MKKLIALLLAITMICSLALTGCGTSKSEETEAPVVEVADATNPVSEDPVVLSVWIPDNTRIEDFNTNDMTLWLEEQGNFDLQISVIPSSDFKTKVNMALTVGAIEDLPDVIIGTSFGASNVLEWAYAESILPLTEYYNDPELAANINEAIARTGTDFTQQLVMPDGEIYTIAKFNQSYGNEYPAKTWIYKPWLDALGAEVPTTTEELYELLKLVSETDLNGNGKKDEIGLLGATESDSYDKWFSYLMNPFIYAGDQHFRVVDDGVVSAAYSTDEWKEGLAYIKRMFDEGLIITETLTMADEQFKAQMNTSDHTVFALTYYQAGMVSDMEIASNYMCIEPVIGPKGTKTASFVPTAASAAFLVTANCKNPEAAFKLGDLLSSEVMGISQRWGTEGKDWDYAANVENISEYRSSYEDFDLYLVAYDDTTFWSGTELTNSSWRQTGPFVRQYAIANGRGVAAASVDQYTLNTYAANSLYQKGGWAPEEVISTLIYTSEESDVIAEIESNLDSFVKEYWTAVMMGTKNLEGDWDAYLQELEAIGLNDYLEVVQKAYDRMYK